ESARPPYSSRRAADLLREAPVAQAEPEAYDDSDIFPVGEADVEQQEEVDHQDDGTDYQEYEGHNGYPDSQTRGPIEHQEYHTHDGGFDAEPSEIFVSESESAEESADDLEPTDTESRIRRILDNLG